MGGWFRVFFWGGGGLVIKEFIRYCFGLGLKKKTEPEGELGSKACIQLSSLSSQLSRKSFKDTHESHA